MITLDYLAIKARDNDWTLTEDESIQVFLLIPEGCIKQYICCEDCGNQELRVKGLGVFEIK